MFTAHTETAISQIPERFRVLMLSCARTDEPTCCVSQAEIICKHLMVYLFTKVLSKCCRSRGTNIISVIAAAIHLKVVIKPVVKVELTKAQSVTQLINNIHQFAEAVTKGVMKEFRSPDQLLEAALTSEDSSFEVVLLKHLKINLGVFLNPRKKSKVSRFFSAVGKALIKPFRCCFKGSSESPVMPLYSGSTIRENVHLLHDEDEERTGTEEDAQSSRPPSTPLETLDDVIESVLHQMNTLHHEASSETAQCNKDEEATSSRQHPWTLAEMITAEAGTAINENLEECREAEPEAGPASAPTDEPTSCVSPAEQELTQMLDSFAQRISSYLIYHLFGKVISKCRKNGVKTAAKRQVSEASIRLTEVITPVVKVELTKAQSVTELKNNICQFLKAVTKGVMKEFRSPDQVLEAALTAEDSSFEVVLLKHLEINLGVFLKPRKKSKFSRFFSAVGKALTKPFRCCFKGSSDD